MTVHARPESYKAAIFRGVGHVDVVDLPYPPCGDDEAIVRNVMTGICGSDIFAYQKHGPQSGIFVDGEFGHEAISEIVELGKDVKNLQVGDRVFVNQGKALRDMRRMSAVGGFSNYLRIPQCVEGYSLLRIDNDIPLRTAVLFEPFVIGARGVKILNQKPGDCAIVFGAGIIGMTSAIMLDWLSAEKVMVVDLSEYRLENARKLGFETCNPAKEDLREKARATFGTAQSYLGERCAARLYVDCLGVKQALEYFTMLAPREAEISIVGVHKEPVAIDWVGVSFSNWHIHGCGNADTESLLPEIVAMMKSGRYDLSSLVTHEFHVEQINEAIQRAADPHGAQKVCITF